MTSILTNNGAMVALQTLKSINNDLGTVQEQISTGKKVGTASDNAAVWAISKTMEADVTGFKKISEGLAVGKSTVAVARDASETVTDLLTQMKDKIVQAQGEGVDISSKEKIQADITALTKQIGSVVSAAQFNGRNLVDGSTNSPMNVLSSLDRDIDGNVKAANIGVNTADLTTTQQAMGTDAATLASYGAVAGTPIAGGAAATGTVSFVADSAAEGVSYKLTLQGGAANDFGTTAVDFEYVAAKGETEADVGKALQEKISAYLTENNVTDVAVAANATTGELTFTNTGAAAADNLTVALAVTTGGTAAGGLAALGEIDVTAAAADPLDPTSKTGAEKAMAAIEGLIQKSIDAASSFGTSENQIETQANFVSKLSDTLTAGIGSMVDADMEEASARLKALQTQQQLGIQSLSIANQAPGAIMSLFR